MFTPPKSRMSSRERMLASYRGLPVDRVPIRIWGADPWMEVWHPSYQPILDAAREHSDMCVGWGTWANHFLSDLPDLPIRTTERPSRHEGFVEQVTTYETPRGPLTSVEAVSTEHKPGRTLKFFIENEDDALAWLSVPYVQPRPDVSEFFEMDRRLGDQGLMTAYIGSPAAHVYFMMGSELMALWSVDNRDLLRTLIATAQKRMADHVQYLLEQGVGPVFGYVGPEICIPPLMGPRDFREFVVDMDKPFTQMIRNAGGLLWVHCHGGMGPCLEGFLEMGVNCLNPVEPPPNGDVTLAQARAVVGSRMCLEGNIEADDLFRATTGRIRALVRQAIEEARGGPFILCPTAGFMEWPTCNPEKVENFLTFIEAGLEYGQDPG
ncbi:MAG: uroporphyrinogen decarboxylase family protein [Anaerolineae bacterium]